MAEELDIPVGAPVWMDLVTSDQERSVAFYCELFGWTVNDSPPEFGGYQYFELDGKAVGGCMTNQPDFQAPDMWSIFLKSTDVRATAQAVQANGGKLVAEPMDVSENGSLGIFLDPGQATISAWQPGTEKGFGVLQRNNTATWFELLTRNYDESVAFYRDAFNWDAHSMADEPEFRYTTFGEGENIRAGIMDATQFMAEDEPAKWSVYIHSDDVDKTFARALELGATGVHEPKDTPFGRMATLSDPTGATFKLHHP